jgi:hypothetical protein
LVIFIIDCLSDYLSGTDDVQYLSKLIELILTQKNKLNEYICSKIILLLSKIDKIILKLIDSNNQVNQEMKNHQNNPKNVNLIPLVFEFYSKIIFYEKLSVSGSESFL